MNQSVRCCLDFNGEVPGLFRYNELMKFQDQVDAFKAKLVPNTIFYNEFKNRMNHITHSITKAICNPKGGLDDLIIIQRFIDSMTNRMEEDIARFLVQTPEERRLTKVRQEGNGKYRIGPYDDIRASSYRRMPKKLKQVVKDYKLKIFQ